MKRVGIIGANGQVGTEVCLFLREIDEIEVVPICRTEVGAVFLRRCGFEPRLGSIGQAEEARELLAGCDLVADFSLPRGSSTEVRRAVGEVVSNAVKQAPQDAPFVYMSSVTAFGIPNFQSPLKHYRLSGSQYGANKRFGEGLARRTCAQAGRPAYVLRAGVVHGEIQAVSQHIERSLRRTAGLTTYIPDSESYTVFAYSLAEALSMILRGRESPGTYTLISNPAWSWKDLHEYYMAKTQLASPIFLLPPESQDRVRGIRQRTMSLAWRLVASQRDVIRSYAPIMLPSQEPRLRARYRSQEAASEIGQRERLCQYRPYGNQHSVFPGPRLASLSDSRITMEEPARRVRAVLQGVLG